MGARPVHRLAGELPDNTTPGSSVMHRRPLLELLDVYQRAAPEESATVARICALVTTREKCFERDCLPGHITASSWIVSHDLERVLLTHHRKLGSWLQLGGHADGETCTLDVALREAREESGMQNFRIIVPNNPMHPTTRGDAQSVPFDVDIHMIPARKGEPAHEHHDIRYLLLAEPDQALSISDESIDLRWFGKRALASLRLDQSMLRMQTKAASLLAALPQR